MPQSYDADPETIIPAPFEKDTDIHTLRSQDIHLTPSHRVLDPVEARHRRVSAVCTLCQAGRVKESAMTNHVRDREAFPLKCPVQFSGARVGVGLSGTPLCSSAP